jgi:D-alanyl-D-alanine carboxypeptidase (penicillin-binding protein 5/6)
MTRSARALASVLAALLYAVATLAAGVLTPSAAAAQGLFDHPKYASIVVDANTGEVLFALRADAPRVPASITKIMTLYLTFEALETGRIKLSDPIVVSAHAAGMIPSKTALRPGETLTVDEAIRVVAILSANDIAVALGEHISGSEAKFAQLMTLRAQELGMTGTRFVNASGVPDPGNRQITTARDIAILSRAVMRDYPQYYSYFSQKEFDFRGRHLVNHNHLLLRMPGVDGLKTGYTAAAGFNLAASALRDGRRIITVVLGGSSTAARDENVEDLLSAGFNVLSARAHGQTLTVASLLSAPYEAGGAVVRTPTDVGSGDQPGGLQLAAADPQHLPGEISDAMMAPPEVGRSIRTATHTVCDRVKVVTRGRHHRMKVSYRTACRQSSAPAGVDRGVEITKVVAAAPTPSCRRLKGHAKLRCERQSPDAVLAKATPECDKIKSAKARASCRRIEGVESGRVAVAEAPKLRGCSGKAARRSKACRASETTVASTAVRHGKGAAKARSRHTEVGETTPRKARRIAHAG